jgi:2',3'-cyclic-nucleotide 2'-phosphodiesterase (5'-nucleotidase family)
MSEKSYTLQILHSSDNESAFQDPNTLEPRILHYASVVEGLSRITPNTIHVTAGDHSLPNPFYEAAEDVSFLGARGLADIAFFNAMGLDANGIGNHEFDGGINDFARMLATADYPFIAVNMDFRNAQLESGTPAIRIGVDGGSVEENAGKIVRSAYVTVGGEKIGLIGRAPADFFNVINDPDNTMPGVDFYGGKNPEDNQPLVSATQQVMEQAALLESQGINKIILLDHAQDFTGDPLTAKALSGIDVIVSAGSTGFMGNTTANGPFNMLRPGDKANAAYPTKQTDKDGNTLLVVNTDQLYSYVGNLIITFDKNGHITSVDPQSGPVATTLEAITALEQEIGQSLSPPQEVQQVYDALVNTTIIKDQFQIVGESRNQLNGTRAFVRTQETNLGRLAADSTLWYAQKKFSDLSVDIALKNGGGIRATILGPKVTKILVGAALAFNNKLSVVELTGDELLATMENAVSRVPAADGRFPHVAGVYLEFDAAKPGISDKLSLTETSRIKELVVTRASGSRDVLVKNFVVQGNLNSKRFVLATNSFLLTGGDGYRALKAAGEARGSEKTEIGERQILIDYIQQELNKTVDIADPPAQKRVVQIN